MVHLTRVAGFLGATHSSSYMFGEWKASVWTFSVPLKSVWMWKWNQERAKEMGSPRSMAVKGMALHAFSWARDSSLSLPTLEALDLSLLRKMAISLGTSNMPLTFHLIISVLGFRFCMLHKTTEYDLASNDSKWTCISLQKLVPNSHEITQPNCQFGDKPVRQAVGSVGECKGVALCGWGFVCWVVGAGRAVSLFKGRGQTKIPSGQILLTCYLFTFLHADFVSQIKTITCLPSKWFSVDEIHLKNPEGKQRK